MSTPDTSLFRRLLTNDLAAREAGFRLLAAVDVFDPALSSQLSFLAHGFANVNHSLALDIGSLGGMAGEW